MIDCFGKITERPQAEVKLMLIGSMEAKVQQQVFGGEGQRIAAGEVNRYGALPQAFWSNAVAFTRVGQIPVDFKGPSFRIDQAR
jgi:hypothetical protein